jgi:glycosyltransferase involved in cell wall biosynthesis
MASRRQYRGLNAESSQADGFDARSLPVLDPRTMARLGSLVHRFRPEVVVASGDCFVGLAGLRCARATGAKFVFDVYDDYRAFDAYRIFLGWDAFGFLARRADGIWYASRELASSHIAEALQTIVPNGVDPSEFRPIDKATARTHAGLPQNRQWIGYFGSLEPQRGAEDLVAAVGQLYEQDPAIGLVICGGGAQVDLRADWVLYRGNVPHSAIPDYINACEVVVLPYRRGKAIDMVSSCKMAEYLFCARPIVATLTPSLTSNFAQQADELGLAIASPGDVTDLARAIAFQIKNGIVASPPSSYSWRDIAAAALDALT